MSKNFVITNKYIVRAPNVSQAKSLVFENVGKGDVLDEDLSIVEISEDEIVEYINEKDSSYTQSSIMSITSEDINDDYENDASFSTTVSNSRNEFLRSENKRLAKLVEKHKNVQHETAAAAYQAAFDVFSNFELPKIKQPILKDKKHKTPETAVAVFADWQMGKITPTYNTNILEQRIEQYTEKLIEITEIQRMDHNVDDLHVWLLGDIVEGEEIFPGQAHLIDSGLYRQVGINGPRILGKFLTTALQVFKRVHVVGVIGNHGAVGGKMRRVHDPETNMDRLLYKIVDHMFEKEERITFNIPDGVGERNWYAVDTIGGYGSLLIHGDQLPAPTSYHGYYKKVMGWKDGAIPEHFDDVFMGHYHQQFKMTIGSTMLRISGSPESNNTYAQEFFSSMSRPCQHLMYIHPEHGVTSEYSIWLD
jgi:hypothetical protein